ncbi:hypothetical protein ACT3UQ_06830 [Glutamicibacter sp. AOP12-B1-11]|uniref:hypothetical protein n=1 Tax=Micrococcaceae TaxID=1268 RepID=UPI0015E2F62B|nr:MULTISPECIES: hypothetical protein [unclassified Arthrobacter]
MNMEPPRPKPVAPMDDQRVDATLSSLGQQDVISHAAVYEQLLDSLQAELNSTEHHG